eukprot:2589925-Pyramimonas_sp.AAC.1
MEEERNAYGRWRAGKTSLQPRMGGAASPAVSPRGRAANALRGRNQGESLLGRSSTARRCRAAPPPRERGAIPMQIERGRRVKQDPLTTAAMSR